MKNPNKNLKKVFGVAFLVFSMLATSFTVYATGANSEVTNNSLIESIINKKDSKISFDDASNPNVGKANLDLHFASDTWESLKAFNQVIEFKLPSGITINNELNISNTDANYERDTLHNLDNSILQKQGDGFTLDFTGVEQLPTDFRIELDLVNTLNAQELKSIDLKEYPILSPFIKDMIAAVPQSEVSEEVTNQVEPEQKQEVKDTNTIQEDDSTKLGISGSVDLVLDGEPKARLKNRNGEISNGNPIVMDSYSEQAGQYSMDLYTNKDTNQLDVNYIVKLDEESISKISEDLSTQAVDFKFMKNGEQSPYEYEYAFPTDVYFHDATGDEILASTKLKDYTTSTFARVNKESNDGAFKLQVKEVALESNGSKQFLFQEYISYQLSLYIHDLFDQGKSLDEVKDELRNGVEIASDAYNIKDYAYKQHTKDEISKLEDYPIEFKNFMNSNKDIKESYPVLPSNSISHQLNATSFEQSENGFDLIWDGIINTNRKSELNSLNLKFDAPSVVKTSGISTWEIETILKVEYFTVLNDGTLVKSTEYQEETITKVNTSTTGIDPINIELSAKNIVVKYQVEQKYKNADLNIEVEGKQVARLSSSVNTNQLSVNSENMKEFPNSLVLNGVKGAEGTPTSLIWNVNYNNNELIRKADDGFDFEIDKNTIKAYKYNGTGDNYSELPVNYDQMKIKVIVNVDGKSIEKDDRFIVTWNADQTKATIRIKDGVTVDKVAKFSFRYEIDVKEEYATGVAIRDALRDSAKLKFDGSSTVQSYTNGKLIEPSKPTEEELKARVATNYLVLLDKRPVMVDYRTKEVIWGVTINTVTAERLGLAGLTYSDKFGSGLEFAPMNEDNPILMFQVDSKKEPKTSYGEYSKFIGEVKKIMDDREIYSDAIPQEIINLLAKPIDEESEDSKVYGDIISMVDQSNISYILDENANYAGEDFVLTQPSVYSDYVSKLSGVIQNGDGDPYTSSPTKAEYLKDKDLRLDFVTSNASIGGAQDQGDNNAYYIMYKTKLSSDKPMESVSNEGSLLFADWVPGTGNTINWGGGDLTSSKDLGEVAKYNTIPKKEGVRKVVYDETTNRNRLAVEWDVTFNYDVDTRRVDNVPMVVVDTIDKTRPKGDYTLGNENLVAQDISHIVLDAYSVDKDGNLKLTDVKVDVTKDSGELSIVDGSSDNKIEYVIKKDLDPQYVYRFKLVSFIESEDASIVTSEDEISNVNLNGEFENKVSYTRGSTPGQVDLPEPGVATSVVNIGNQNRVSKTGQRVSGSYTGSRQETLWTITVNEGFEDMQNLVISDKLESMHTFQFIKNPNDLEELDSKGAKLDRFSMQEYSNGAWRSISNTKYDYTITNLDGKTDQPLDNWATGESGFVMTFNEPVQNPIRINFATFGRVVDNKEIPLKNHATIDYDTNTGEHLSHKVVAEVSFKVNDGNGGYDNEKVDVGLQMRYNDNQQASPTDLTLGNPITGNHVENTVVILYRYQDNFVQNNHIYRVGHPNSDGYVEFKNIEVGDYIIKQYKVADGYSVPYSLGYVDPNINTIKDKSVVIDNNQLLSGNLTTINIPKGKAKAEETRKVDYAVYNTTPVFEVKSEGKLNTANGSAASEVLKGTDLNVQGDVNYDSSFTSSNDGTFKVGTVNKEDPRIQYGEYSISQPDQELNGYLHNSETVKHTVKSNQNGTVDATSVNATFNNYKTNANLKVVERGTTTSISNSTYELYKYDGTSWVAYSDAASTGKKDGNIYEVTNGSLDFYNIDTGRYQLRQTSVGGGYLRNTTPLEFYAYGPTTQVTSVEGKPEMMQLTFENIKSSLTFTNVIGNEKIDGSTFNVKNALGDVVETFTISDKENGHVTTLVPGDYTLVETATSNNRPLNTKPMTFTIKPDELNENGEVISSYNIEFVNHLGSFVFNTYTPTDVTFDVDSFQIKNGDHSLDDNKKDGLYTGNHTVSAIAIPSEWIHVLEDYSFNIPSSYSDEDELVQSVDVYATKGTLPFVNYDGDTTDNTVLSDGLFTLKDANDKSIAQDGNKFIEVEPGTYEFAQTKAPSGYGINTELLENINVPSSIAPSEVTIDKDSHSISFLELSPLTYYNYRGKVNLTKLSAETGNKLSGVEFKLYRDGEELENYTTDANGEIYLDKLAPANYYFEELKGDGSHVAGPASVAFTIASSNAGAYPVKEVSVNNYYADAEFKNTDPSHEVIYKDGLFTLYKQNGSEWTEVDGYIDFKISPNEDQYKILGVQPGNYKLLQTKAPSNTVRNTFEYTFEIPDYVETANDGRITITLDDYINYQAKVNLDLIDQNGQFKNIVDAVFVDSSNNETTLTNTDAKLTKDALGSGKYTIQIRSAQDAIVFDEVTTFEIPESALNDEGLEFSKVARMTYAKNEFNLVDGKSKDSLTSGEFSVNDELYKVDKEGRILLDFLTPNTYNFKQVKAADSYILNTLNVGSFEVFQTRSEFDQSLINEDGYPYIDLGKQVFDNYQGTVVIHKINEDKESLEGVEFTMKSDDSSMSEVTDTKGLATIEGLAPGTYMLSETKALEGYELLKDSKKVEIVSSAQGEPEAQYFEVTNKKIKKVDPEKVKPDGVTPPTTGVATTSTIIWYSVSILALGIAVVSLVKYRNKRTQK